MAKHTTLTSLFTAIADAIRAKKGTTDVIVADNFPDEIAGITAGGGVDVSGVTATAADVLSPKVIIDKNGVERTGTISTKTSSDLTASGAKVTVPAGYYASAASKSVSTATQATPSITVTTDGVITASATQSAGYVSSGTKSATKQLTTQAAKTIMPGATPKTAVSSGVYTTGDVIVAGDGSLTPGNIASGVSIFGVTGTYTGSSGGSGYIGSAVYAKRSSVYEIRFTVNTTNLIGFMMLPDEDIERVGSAITSLVYINGSYYWTESFIDSSYVGVGILKNKYMDIAIGTTTNNITITSDEAAFPNIQLALYPIYSA